MALSIPALEAVNFAAQIYGGWSKNQAYKRESSLMAQQGAISYNEAVINAGIIRQQATIFAGKQEMQYIGSGVIYGGSDLITTKQTQMYAGQYADSIINHGAAVQQLDDQKAQIESNLGTASLISGFLGGAVDLIKFGSATGILK